LEKKRALRLSYRILIVLTVVIFIVGLYNLFSFLSTAISGDSFDIDLNKNEITGDWIFSFEANPMNNGVLPISLYFEITLFDLDDNLIATNSSTTYIGAGSSQSLSFSLIIPSEFVQGDDIQGDEGYMKMVMTVRTFADLMGLTQIMRIGGTS
jgi:hypothetical protein